MTVQEMLKMRIDGATYQEIADSCGVTRQCVQHKLKEYSKKITTGKRGRQFSIKEIKFKAIRDYFSVNETETMTSFSTKVYGYLGGTAATLRNFLKGKTESYFTIPQIRRMCEIVGKPFEEVFEEA